MGEERQRHVPDPARCRRRKLSTHHSRPCDPGAARLESPLPVGGLQRHRSRLLHPKERGRGARQCAVDRLDRKNAQGAFRYLIEAVRSIRLAAIYNLFAVGRGGRCPRWVIRDRGGRNRTTVHVRFAPKATVPPSKCSSSLTAKSRHRVFAGLVKWRRKSDKLLGPPTFNSVRQRKAEFEALVSNQ